MRTLQPHCRLKCKLRGETIGIFNGTMLVSENYGRSNANPSTFFVTPDELIYNYQTYAGKYKKIKLRTT
jgi:hypothetical protein